ncbi:MAG: hypothetical protein A2Z14_06300 [Chloroflexi bacterium RBG_16_48_8]|nr:MAG: hypothetical protein A2Z14_06300 [Chloroflexi bacterium RBG_16_48_8]
MTVSIHGLYHWRLENVECPALFLFGDGNKNPRLREKLPLFLWLLDEWMILWFVHLVRII